MLTEIINNPDLDKYMTSFEGGRTIFLEGDDSQDLYILVSGILDVIKGHTKIGEVAEAGAFFGEMSFFLGASRTATVKARSDARTIRIPKEEITTFLVEFPEVAREITKLLAKRLDARSQVLYGLKEFVDQLPDAVILTDRNMKILTWNTAAERLYGREDNQMRCKPVEEIHEEPQDYKKFLEEVQSKYSVSEKVLKIKHPEKGTRYISTSTTVLYDGHHNFQGIISIGRDVTAVKKLERRYRIARTWFIPSLILLGMLAAAVFYGYPYFSRGYQTIDIKKQDLRDLLAKDYLLLKSLLTDPFAAGDRSKTSRLMKEFFEIQTAKAMPYNGLVLLDTDKKVFDAYSIKKDTHVTEMIGSSYAGIAFEGSEKSLHRVLTLYRIDKDHPMGSRGIEITFEMEKDNRFLGWSVFQMNMDVLETVYVIDIDSLKKFQFNKP
jgi:PAS domain S-box-containing protein